MRSIAYAIAFAAVTCGGGAFAAHDTPSSLTADSVPEAGDPEARRRMLNGVQADLARRQNDANAESQRAYDTALANAEIRANLDTIAYARTLRQHDTAVDDYRADRKHWERTNPTCWNGDAVECPAEPATD